jgi:hypothetical protein
MFLKHGAMLQRPVGRVAALTLVLAVHTLMLDWHDKKSACEKIAAALGVELGDVVGHEYHYTFRRVLSVTFGDEPDRLRAARCECKLLFGIKCLNNLECNKRKPLVLAVAANTTWRKVLFYDTDVHIRSLTPARVIRKGKYQSVGATVPHTTVTLQENLREKLLGSGVIMIDGPGRVGLMRAWWNLIHELNSTEEEGPMREILGDHEVYFFGKDQVDHYVGKVYNKMGGIKVSLAADYTISLTRAVVTLVILALCLHIVDSKSLKSKGVARQHYLLRDCAVRRCLAGILFLLVLRKWAHYRTSAVACIDPTTERAHYKVPFSQMHLKEKNGKVVADGLDICHAAMRERNILAAYVEATIFQVLARCYLEWPVVVVIVSEVVFLGLWKVCKWELPTCSVAYCWLVKHADIDCTSHEPGNINGTYTITAQRMEGYLHLEGRSTEIGVYKTDFPTGRNSSPASPARKDLAGGLVPRPT